MPRWLFAWIAVVLAAFPVAVLSQDSQGNSIRGSVMYGTCPSPGVTVSVEALGSGEVRSAVSEADGGFQVRGLPAAGAYRVFPDTRNANDAVAAQVEQIELRDGEQGRISLGNHYRLYGSVSGCERDPYRNAEIYVRLVGERAMCVENRRTSTNQDGEYSIDDDLPAGTYEVAVGENGVAIRSETIQLGAVRHQDYSMVICPRTPSRLDYSPWRKLGATTWR